MSKLSAPRGECMRLSVQRELPLGRRLPCWRAQSRVIDRLTPLGTV
jgi:hypothetical protein